MLRFTVRIVFFRRHFESLVELHVEPVALLRWRAGRRNVVVSVIERPRLVVQRLVQRRVVEGGGEGVEHFFSGLEEFEFVIEDERIVCGDAETVAGVSVLSQRHMTPSANNEDTLSGGVKRERKTYW